MGLAFEWNEEKAETNLKKHGVSFDEATTVFRDPISVTIDEQRYVEIGSSEKGQLLVVVYTERGASIRIISCRKATPSERKVYEESHE